MTTQFQSQSMHSRHTADSMHALFPTACATSNATTSLENMLECRLSCAGRRVCLAVVSGVSPTYILHFTSLTHLLLLKLSQKTCWRHPWSQLQVTQLTITNMTVCTQIFIFETFTIICYSAIRVSNSISSNATSFFWHTKVWASLSIISGHLYHWRSDIISWTAITTQWLWVKK